MSSVKALIGIKKDWKDLKEAGITEEFFSKLELNDLVIKALSAFESSLSEYVFFACFSTFFVLTSSQFYSNHRFKRKAKAANRKSGKKRPENAIAGARDGWTDGSTSTSAGESTAAPTVAPTGGESEADGTSGDNSVYFYEAALRGIESQRAVVSQILSIDMATSAPVSSKMYL